MAGPQVLRNNNNYNTLMAVLAGVNSAAVLRLRQTRKLLQNRQSYRNYQALERLMSSERSFANYRQALRRSELPCIPYLSVHATSSRLMACSPLLTYAISPIEVSF